MKEIRRLYASEIEVRVGSGGDNGKSWCTLLLYKDARVDQRLLDEVYGTMNWQREHTLIDGQLFCTVSIWDETKNQWVKKQDVGVESMTEKEKGRASDAFKRACFNIGIGRELYTAPLIFVNLKAEEYKNNKLSTRFECTEIGYDDDGNINKLCIVDNHGVVRYKMGSTSTKSAPKATSTPQPTTEGKDIGVAIAILKDCKTQKELKSVFTTFPQYKDNKEFKDTANALWKQLPSE